MKIFCASRDGKNGSEAAYALLGSVYRSEFDSEPPPIEKTRNGKPFFPSRSDIHFSLSHSKTHVLCALSRRPVGADIESLRQISERAVNYFCFPDELEVFDPLDLWVLKESYIKLIGGTLSMVKKIRFSLDGDRIVAPDENAFPRLYRVGECRVAVTAFGAPPAGDIDIVSPALSTQCTFLSLR